MAAARKGSEACVQISREICPASVNDVDHKDQTALHHVSHAGHVRTPKELLAFPTINVHFKDHFRRNALSLVSQQGHLPVVRILHRRNGDAASTDVTGRNAVSWAANSLKATAYT
ncbi:hypothetical protein EPUS_04270 [Endocarpon pusillum Z07020]|uniref:Uncharacterized protein n=1 Tax=Endocarpon pusillum (strain Z07020 / HMAS-L-300199) TaxID=1263415 RepID=U1HQV1_ENDPU|nr:uncharacterized protein EPUS_04270 [Endocarpon pusillum Z07020]ERF72835.1 hypothetical protein EPUS_04270 [Endocarpon pusillum Z07020]